MKLRMSPDLQPAPVAGSPKTTLFLIIIFTIIPVTVVIMRAAISHLWEIVSVQDGTEHFYRTQGGTNQYIANNDFADHTVSKTSIQIRGNGTKNVVITENSVTSPMGIHPQNEVQEEYVSNVLVEGNLLFTTLNITATTIVVRNNIFSSCFYRFFGKIPIRRDN